jgi:arylsulfatase A-like enzyme
MLVVISLDGFPAAALADPKLPIPALRDLARKGFVARMTTETPTITWPAHTTMVTGVRSDKHGLLLNGSIVPTGAWPPIKVDPMIAKREMVHARTVYDAAHEAGLTTAQVDWVAINDAPTITWPFSEWASPQGAVEREMIGKGVIAANDVENFAKANILFRDQIWTAAGVHLIREHKPNLLLFHLLALDTTQHSYGPDTLAATGAIAFLDSCVARLVDAVRAAGMTERTTFIVVSDHGFKPVTKQIRPSIALASAGLGDKVHVLPEGGTAYVYLRRAEAAELAPKVKQLFEGVEGIDRVLAPDAYAALGLPQPDRDPAMFQLLLVAKDNYSFSGATGGPVTAEIPQQGGSHGYLGSDPAMNAIFLASGYGVSVGKKVEKVANIDVAPTLAKLLNVTLPDAIGKPIPLN